MELGEAWVRERAVLPSAKQGASTVQELGGKEGGLLFYCRCPLTCQYLGIWCLESVSVPSKLLPAGGAQPGCHPGFMGELSPCSPLPSSLSSGQPLSCLLLQSTLWPLIFPETSLSHCLVSCTPGLTGEASLLHNLPWASPPPLVTHPELLAS